MIATKTAELLHKLRMGIIDPVDTGWLEQISADDFLADLRSRLYPMTFQERRIGAKWEISLARSIRAELAVRPIPDAIFVSFILVPAYLNCLMLNIENNRVTGISRLARLTVWAVSEPEEGLALKSGNGFKLDKTVDGWDMKPLRKRVVKLSAQFLRQRGWRLDHLKQLIPS